MHIPYHIAFMIVFINVYWIYMQVTNSNFIHHLHKRTVVLSLYLALYTDTSKNFDQLLKGVCSNGKLLRSPFRQVFYIGFLFQVGKPDEIPKVGFY